MSINREALLKAAAALSDSSEDSSEPERGRRSRSRSRSPSRKRHHSDKKAKHSKKQKKQQKRHKRSEHDKIQEFERRAAAIGATSLIPRLPVSLATTTAGCTGDAAVLDTVGDANNTTFESLYAGSVPRYNRLDPMNIVSKARFNWQAQLQQPDRDAGNSRADRYYKGRHFLLERSRTAKRIHLSDLRPTSLAATALQQHSPFAAGTTNSGSSGTSSWLLPDLPEQRLAAAGVSFPSPAAGTGTAGTSGAVQSSSRRLIIPAPAFIPLEPPEGLLKAAGGDDGAAAAGAAVGAAGGAGVGLYGVPTGLGGTAAARKIDPELLVDQAGLSPDELVLRSTRAWNVALRQHPHQEQLWLDFAAFQHAAAKLLQQQRSRSDAADAATAEKQVSLLTRGLSHHPSSSPLLLALLRAYSLIAPDAAALADKWWGVLGRKGGSWLLWREYLALKQATFADFRISAVQQSYQQALHALYMELLSTRRKAAAAHKQHQNHTHQQQCLTQQQLALLSPAAAAAAVAGGGGGSGVGAAGAAAAVPLAAGEEGLELQLVQLLLGLMHCEMAAGHTEQALAKIQALLEYHLFPPPSPPGGPAALLRLFAAYWGSSSARIGQAGARGWAYWCCWHAMGLQPPVTPAAEVQEEDQAEQQEPAGWSGWFEVPHKQQQQQPEQQQQQQQGDQSPGDKQQDDQQQQRRDKQQPQQLQRSHKSSSHSPSQSRQQGQSGDESGEEDGEVSEQQSPGQQEEEEEEGEEEEFDEVDLMLQLGVQLEEQLQQMEAQGLPPHIVHRWVKEEAARSSSQWQPLHHNPKQQQQQQGTDGSSCDGQDPDPARVVGFEAVEPCLFPVRSFSALRRLVLGCVELLGAPVGPWCSSNCPTPLQQVSLGVPAGPAGLPVTPAAVPGLGVTPTLSRGGGMQWSDASADEIGPAAAAAGEGPPPAAAAAAAVAGAGLAASPVCQQLAWYQGSDERWGLLVSLLERLVAGGPCSSWPELCQALLLLHASKPSDCPFPAAPAGGCSGSGAAAAAAAGPGVSSSKGQGSGSEGDEGSAAADLLMALTIDGAAAACGGSSSSNWPSPQQMAAVRAAAKQLLSDQQDNLLLYDAFGCCEAAVGQVKTARKVFESALTLATAAAAGAGSSSAAGSAGGVGAAVSTEATVAAAAAPLLALHLAQLELSALGAKGSAERAHAALHACLAGEPYRVPAATTKSTSSATAAAAGSGLVGSSNQQQGLLADRALTKARRGFQDSIPCLLVSAGGALTPAAAASVAAAALFELTVGLLTGRAGQGMDAAAAVYRQVLAAVPAHIRAASEQHEQLQVLYCHMLVAAATGATDRLVPSPGAAAAAAAAAAAGGNAGGTAGGKASSSSSSSSNSAAAAAASLLAAVTPARARTALASALQLYPHSQTLLNLQVQLDHSCHTLAGLRRQLAALTDLNPSPGLWGVALQAEALRPGGRVRLRALFERALAAPSPLQWHQQQRLRRQRQQQAWAAAVAEVAGSSPHPAKPPQNQSEQEAAAQQQEREQQRLLQAASAASASAVLLDVAIWDGYRGWSSCSALWQQYMQYELSQGRQEAARKLLLRALHECPGSKGLWLSGFGALCGGMQPRESSGLLAAMQEREVVMRTDVYEVLLADMAEQQQ